MKIQAYLQFAREPIQIPSPNGETIHVSTEPAYYTDKEILLIEQFIQRLPYTQNLVKTGAQLIGSDPLLSATVEQIEAIEAKHGYTSLRKNTDGSPKSLRDRVLMLRENGYSAGVIN